MARGSAGLCFKSKCRAFTRVEISFDCSMQTGDVIQVKSGGNFGFLRDRSFFAQTYRNYCVTSHHPPNSSSALSETEFLIIALGTVTVGLSRCPIDFQIWRPEPPQPPTPPSPPLLLGDASMVTALYKLSPGGSGAARFKRSTRFSPEFVRTTIPSISFSTLG